MDPISIAIEIELGALMLAVVGGIATWMTNHHNKARRKQRDRHHQELKLLRERLHREHLAALRATREVAEEAIQVFHDEEAAPVSH